MPRKYDKTLIRKSNKPEEMKQILDDKLEKIANYIRIGLTTNNAAVAAGVQPVTLYRWKMRAQKGDEPYASAMETFARAVKEGEAILAARLFEASKKDWKAALAVLERRHSKDWGKKENAPLQDGEPVPPVEQARKNRSERLRELEGLLDD